MFDGIMELFLLIAVPSLIMMIIGIIGCIVRPDVFKF